MPALEQTAVTEWLTEVRPASDTSEWPPAVRAIEIQGRMPAQLADLGLCLDEVARLNPQALAKALLETPLRRDLAAVMTQLGGARQLRLLHWIAEMDLPDRYAIVSALLEGHGDEGRSLSASISALTRRAILRRMFATERVATLEAAVSEIA